NGATLVERDGGYHVLPTAKAAAESLPAATATAGEGTEVVPLRFAAARDLAKVLQPYVGEGGRLAAASAPNALVVTAGRSARQSVAALIGACDVYFPAGRSYAIFPVGSDDLAKVADELKRFVQSALESGAESAVRVLPLERVNAVLVVARQPIYLERVR